MSTTSVSSRYTKLRTHYWKLTFIQSVAVFLVSLGIVTASSLYLYRQAVAAQNEEINSGLIRLAKAARTLVDPDLHRTFVKREQQTSPEYLAANQYFVDLFLSDPEISYVYTAIMRDEAIYFILDGTPDGYDVSGDGESDSVELMEMYIDRDSRDENPAMWDALEHQRIEVSGEPYTDEWGTFFSAYVPFHASDGEFVGVVGVDLDIQDYYSRLNQVRYALAVVLGVGLLISSMLALIFYYRKRRADIAESQKARYFEGVSHDLRTPLHAIAMKGEFLSHMAADTDTTLHEVRSDLQDIQHQCELLTSMVANQLEVASIHAGGVSCDITTVFIRDLIEKRLPSFRLLAEEKGLSLEISLPPASATLESDPHLLDRIISNLVGNAIKYTETGTVDFSCNLDKDGEYMTFCVTDTGPGIPEGVRDQIFQPFFQLETAPARKKTGYGLGLSICAEFAKVLGGKLTFEPRTVGGSRFVFTVPTRQ